MICVSLGGYRCFWQGLWLRLCVWMFSNELVSEEYLQFLIEEVFLSLAIHRWYSTNCLLMDSMPKWNPWRLWKLLGDSIHKPSCAWYMKSNLTQDTWRWIEFMDKELADYIKPIKFCGRCERSPVHRLLWMWWSFLSQVLRFFTWEATTYAFTICFLVYVLHKFNWTNFCLIWRQIWGYR